uniref:39S ribosomal protein L39, mitochondrial n=1 Tax=Heterorhabditis bacteriophora TaxID=37862 RepID=A0A1I7X0U7_HETBA
MWRRLPTYCKIYSSLRSLVTSPVPNEGIYCSTEFNLSPELFDDIRKRVYSQGRSIQKIVISVPEKDEPSKNYLMNRNISTPHHCAKHINRSVASNSALSFISNVDNTTIYHSMNEPLEADCTLEFLDFNNEKHAKEVNTAYWRSCAVVLAYTLSQGLREPIKIKRYHDEVKKSYFAVDINQLESQLSTVKTSNSSPLPLFYLKLYFSVCICRLGSFVTTVSGPVIASTNQIGRFTIVKVLETSGVVRVAGVSLPSVQQTSSYVWQTIVKNAEDRCI